MIFPSLAALGTGLYFLGRRRPRLAVGLAAAVWVSVRAFGDPHHGFVDALFEPDSLKGIAVFAAASALVFVGPLRRGLLRRWAFGKAKRRAQSVEPEAWAGGTTRLEAALDAGDASDAVEEILRIVRPAMLAGTDPRKRPARDPVRAALDDSNAAQELDASDGSIADAYEWAGRHALLGLELHETWGGHAMDTERSAQAIRRATTHSVELGAALAIGNIGSPLALVLRYGTDAQRAQWAAPLASGEATAVLTWAGHPVPQTPLTATVEPAAAASGDAGSGAAAATGGTLQIDGALAHVPAVRSPDLILLAASLRSADGTPLAGGPVVVLLPANTPGLNVVPDTATDAPLATVTVVCERVRLDETACLGGSITSDRGAEAVEMATASAAAVTLPSLASGLVQREAMIASYVTAVTDDDANRSATARSTSLATIAAATFRCNAIARSFGYASDRSVVGAGDHGPGAESILRSLHDAFRASDALFADHEGAEHIPARPMDITALDGLLASLAPEPAARAGANLSAIVRLENAAAAHSDAVQYDRVRTHYFPIVASRWIRGLTRPLIRRGARRATVTSALDATVELHAIVALAASRESGRAPQADSEAVTDAMRQARAALAGAVTSRAMFEADGKQQAEHVLASAAIVDATATCLDALELALTHIRSVVVRSAGRWTLRGCRRSLAHVQPDSSHVAAALIGDQVALARITPDVQISGSLAPWQRAASSRSRMRVPMARIAEARALGQLPEDNDDGQTVQLAVERGLISSSDRELIEQGWAASAAVLGRSRASSAQGSTRSNAKKGAKRRKGRAVS